MTRWLASLSGLLFIVCAVVQYNDPDPALWIIIYGAAAVICFMFLKNRISSTALFILAGASFIGTYFLWPPQFEGILFSEIQTMRNMNIELARESLGLAIVGIIMAILGNAQRTKAIAK